MAWIRVVDEREAERLFRPSARQDSQIHKKTPECSGAFTLLSLSPPGGDRSACYVPPLLLFAFVLIFPVDGIVVLLAIAVA